MTRFLFAVAVALSMAQPSAAAPLEAYGRLPMIETLQISPDGKRLASIVADGEQRFVHGSNVEGGAFIGGARAGETKVRRVEWAGPDHLIISASTTASIPGTTGPWAEYWQVPPLTAASTAAPPRSRGRPISSSWCCSRGQTGVAAQRYWLRFMGAEKLSDPVLAEISPAAQAEKVDIPVLLVHGRDDTIVPLSQSQIMADALRKAGKPGELLVMKGEDHWLTRGETRQQMLTAVMNFLERNKPAELKTLARRSVSDARQGGRSSLSTRQFVLNRAVRRSGAAFHAIAL